MAHDSVMTHRAYQASLLSIMRTAVDVIANAIRKRETGPQSRQVEVAIKIDPLTAISGPCGSAKGFPNPTREDGLLHWPEMFTSHFRNHTAQARQRFNGLVALIKQVFHREWT
jgi:hypothetical protein